MLNWVNLTCDPGQPDLWPGLCPESSLELSFKIMIIIIFIFTCFSWIILELKVFYNDILEMKDNKYYL